MEEVATSQGRLFWRRLGLWQVIMAILVNVAFFISTSITGDKESVRISMIVVAFIINTLLILLAIFGSGIIPISAAGRVALAAIWASSFNIAKDRTLLVFIAIFILVNAIESYSDETNKFGLNKKMVYLSFMLEFFVICFPLLLF